MQAPKYVNLGKGIKALELWKSIGPKWPQIAILLLSSEEYRKFLKNPKNYLNEHKIFGNKETRKVIRCDLARFQPKKPRTVYALTLKHDWTCTSSAGSSSTLGP